jgi:hypothetical protein
MADASSTFRRAALPRAGLAFPEKYLGLASAVAGIVGVVAIFGSPETLWYYLREFFGAVYMLALVVAS